jgi:hypothetical protein
MRMEPQVKLTPVWLSTASFLKGPLLSSQGIAMLTDRSVISTDSPAQTHTRVLPGVA